MPIKRLTPTSEIDKQLNEHIQKVEQTAMRNMFYVGEQCLKIARSTDSYSDRTGNLRSSIGYVIIKDGVIISESDFQQVKKGTDGAKEGAEFAKSLVDKFPVGIVLIMVAGMNYAAYVSGRGYDVLDSAELLAEQIMKQLNNKG